MCRIKWGTLFWLCVIFNIISQGLSLKVKKFIVPKDALPGDDVTLSCVYDLEDDILYTVSFYFGKSEFYRYTPSENPSINTFSVSGLNVDLSRSNEMNVTIKSISQKHVGYYTCQVSAEAPSFATDTARDFLRLPQFPRSDPKIILEIPSNIRNKTTISFGDEIRATCIQGYSYPAVNFTWIVGGVRLPSSQTFLFGPMPFQNASSDLNININDQIMKVSNNSQIIIRCETNVNNLYRGSTETKIYLQREKENHHDSAEIKYNEEESISLTVEILRFFYYVRQFLIGAIIVTIVAIMIYWNSK